MNIALVVPFGRSALFAQSVGARKRVVEGKLGKRRFAGEVWGRWPKLMREWDEKVGGRRVYLGVEVAVWSISHCESILPAYIY
jgi:hypothetical protein